MVLRFLRKFDFYILLDFPYILLFCNRRKSCPTQTQRINKYFLKKGIKKGRISEKHLWNSPQNEQVIGSNPHQRSILPIGIFLFSLKTDFWKSEENGEKTRKTEETLGFSGGIFFGRSICVITTALIQFNFPSAFEPTGFINGFIWTHPAKAAETRHFRHFPAVRSQAEMPLQNRGRCSRRFHSARNICKRKKCDYVFTHKKRGFFHSHTGYI